MADLFAIGVWAAYLAKYAAHIAFDVQTVKLASAMKKFRKGLVPVALLALGFASFSQAHGMPAPRFDGDAVEEHGAIAGVQRDGISLDEAVRMAEAQYHARVVRTEVVDEDIVAGVIRRDEAKALLVTEPLHCSCSHCCYFLPLVHCETPRVPKQRLQKRWVLFAERTLGPSGESSPLLAKIPGAGR